MDKRNVVLVNNQDKKLGLMDIFEAHRNPGKLHRAISVILINSQDEILLQQRGQKKILWPGFWSNTVCTHPYENESYEACGVRRLDQELGIKLASGVLGIAYRFQYQADYSQEWSEHELDTVMVGRFDGIFKPNPEEVESCRWIGWDDLRSEMNSKPERFTPWFKLILDKIDNFSGLFDMVK